jgi:hypothetical protein
MKQSRLAAFTTVFIFAIWVHSFAGLASAQQPGQRTFPSAEEASRAYFEAAQSDDEKALLDILGPAGKDLIFSGDSSEDENSRIQFVMRFLEMHRVAAGQDGTAALYIGTDGLRMPIPLVNKSGAWYFDTQAGKKEILSRRMGQNEEAAARACHELVDAQTQYYARPSQTGSIRQFAQRFVSEEDDHTGLFWQGAIDEFDSPLDPRIASAGIEHPRKGDHNDPIPSHGYFFRILTNQSAHAPGGVKNYVVNGQMTAGFAFLAYPAQYGASGVMTFIVNQQGTVYRKDLGPDTTRIANAVTGFDPDSTWEVVPVSTAAVRSGTPQ